MKRKRKRKKKVVVYNKDLTLSDYYFRNRNKDADCVLITTDQFVKEAYDRMVCSTVGTFEMQPYIKPVEENIDYTCQDNLEWNYKQK